MTRYRRGVPIPYLEFKNGEEVEDWLNAESPDTYPYSRKPTCDRIALALKLLDIVEEDAPTERPDPANWVAAERQLLWDMLSKAKEESA